MLVGKGQGCSASASGRVLRVVSETDSKEAIECDGGKLGCSLVCYVRSVAIQQLDGYDIQELADLGFWSDPAAPLRKTDGPSNRVGSQERSFIHCCREKGALL